MLVSVTLNCQVSKIEDQTHFTPGATGVVQPKVLKGFLSLAEEEEGSLVESLRVAVGGKEDDCQEGDGPHCQGDGCRDWEGSVLSVSHDAKHPL